MNTTSDSLTLLYDGVCGFCDRVVQFILSRDRNGTMKFAPLQGAFALDVLSRHPEMQRVDSLVLVRGTGANETVSAQSAAVADVLQYLGGGWKIAGMTLRVVPRFIADAAYAAFGRIRYRVFGRFESCRVPSAEQRARFIDPAFHER